MLSILGESIFVSCTELMSADIQEIHLNQIYLRHIMKRAGNMRKFLPGPFKKL